MTSPAEPEDLDELVVHLADLTIDVEEKDTEVRIFAENATPIRAGPG